MGFALVLLVVGALISVVTSGIVGRGIVKNEKDLWASRERLRFVMDSMPQKIFTARPDGTVDYFNPQWTEFTGQSSDQIRDRGLIQFIHPDDFKGNTRAWRQSIHSGRPFQFEHRLRRANGKYHWHISRAMPMKDDTGAVLMWVGSVTDIDDQRQTANELRELATELSEADRRKDEFLAMLAHELRNPLAPILNSVLIVRSAGGNTDAIGSALGVMERQVAQMVRLVDDLLDVGRISRGKIDLRVERVDLAAVARQAVEASRPLVNSMNQTLTITLPSVPLMLNADPTRLAQALGNLLNNASKFTPRDGSILLAVEREGEQAVVRVRDSGIGIAADQLPRIFDIFMQVDHSLERSISGLGIGLTLVKNLVELHGGTVEARSSGIGDGSEFVVRLPALQDAPGLPQPAAPESNPPLTARRILVVDDNQDAAATLALVLELKGHETRTVHDGLEAVQAAATFKPDVVLLDIGLPKLNGYEAARRIREQPWGKSILLVALTGWGKDEDRQKSTEAGFDAHLIKPVDQADLTRLLAESGVS
ncbi:MAG: ATP-binding protein [Candidatus Eisenbacteria bacterium]